MESKDLKSTINDKLSELARTNLELKAECENAHKKAETILDDALMEFLVVLDTFDRAEKYIDSQGLAQSEEFAKGYKRLLNAKKKAQQVLEKYNVSQMVFENNMLVPEWCIVADTEPDSTKPNDQIISIEKNGYLRDGRLLRSAEVIIVKN